MPPVAGEVQGPSGKREHQKTGGGHECRHSHGGKLEDVERRLIRLCLRVKGQTQELPRHRPLPRNNGGQVGQADRYRPGGTGGKPRQFLQGKKPRQGPEGGIQGKPLHAGLRMRAVADSLRLNEKGRDKETRKSVGTCRQAQAEVQFGKQVVPHRNRS